jgi:hypothetical protein
MREHHFHHFFERDMPSSKNIFSLEALFREARKEIEEQSGKQEPLLSQDDITALLEVHASQGRVHLNTKSNTNTDIQ